MIDRAHLKLNTVLNKGFAKSHEKLNFPKVHTALAKEVIGVGIYGYLLGMASINGLYPFALSFMAANLLYRKSYMLPGAFALLGTLTGMKSLSSLRYLGAMGIFWLLYTFLNKVNLRRDFFIGTALFLSNFAAGLVFLLTRGIAPYDMFLLLIESGLAAIMTFIIPGGMPWIFKEPIQDAEKNICVAVLAGVVLSIARNFIWMGINIRDVISVVFVMLMAMLDGPGAGAASGIIIGITGFSYSLSPWSTAIIAFSGLMAGTFNKLGKIGVILGFTVGYFLYNFYVNSMGEILIQPAVLAAAFAVFLLLPKTFIKRMQLYFTSSGKAYGQHYTAIEERARDKLHETASLLKDLSGVFKQTIKKRRKTLLQTEYLNAVCSQARKEVCSHCGMRKICWEKEHKSTLTAFYNLIKALELNSDLENEKDIPALFRARCSKTEDIKKIVKEKGALFKVKRQMENIINENNEVIRNKFLKAADIVENLADGLWEQNIERNMDEEIFQKFSQIGVQVDRVYSEVIDRKFTVNIVKPTCRNDRQCEALIPLAVSDVLGRNVNLKVVNCPLKGKGSRCRLKAIVKGSMEVSAGLAGVAREKQDVSGDGFSILELNESGYLLALCDGMGVGETASRLSEKTLSILERLLEAGYNREKALKITNSAMLAVNSDESFSTIDAALIDTVGGVAKFVKAGAPAGFLKRGKKVDIIKGGSLPVGIIEEISPVLEEKTVRPGDMIVMVTDGIIDAFSNGQSGEKALARFINQTKTTNPQEMAQIILKKAKQKKGIRDDMTVLVAYIWEKR